MLTHRSNIHEFWNNNTGQSFGGFYISLTLNRYSRYDSEEVTLWLVILNQGVYKAQATKGFIKSAGDTSYTYLSFTGLSDGNYKMFFQSMYQDQVDFSGVVYDSK